MLVLAGCSTTEQNAASDSNASNKEVVLYSELDNKFTEDVVDAFNEQQQKEKGKLRLKAIYELNNSAKIQPDLVLAEQRTLNGLKLDGLLSAITLPNGNAMPEAYHDSELYWYGVFYDPTVFLINQQYARTVGQATMLSWSDLENNEGARIEMENLSNSNSTQNFLGAMADHYGETTSINYLWNINRFIKHYGKFPFTGIRMTAVGDADIAITRQSYVFKYLESKFPAYIVIPREGTPVNLYGIGMFAGASAETVAVMEWMLTDDDLRSVAQRDATGYMFLKDEAGVPVNPNKLWLNKSYLTAVKQDALTRTWLERVRFSK